MCDMDYIYLWVKKENYEPKNYSMEDFIENMIGCYEDEIMEDDEEFMIEGEKVRENKGMICVQDLAAFIKNSGGLAEFDY